MPELQQKPQKRQIAIKVNVKEIINGKYVKEEGWLPNYIQTEDGRRVSRANIIGTVVFKSDEENFIYKNFVIDDGSAKISVRSFEKNDNLSKFDIGDVILIIGRPREFNNEIYIIPEIIKKIEDTMWIEVRKLELDKFNKNLEIKTTNNEIKKAENLQNEIVHEEINQDSEDNLESEDSNIIYKLIKKLDTGNGISIEDIIKKSDSDDAERLIGILLENGDIFEVRSGIIKVLE